MASIPPAGESFFNLLGFIVDTPRKAEILFTRTRGIARLIIIAKLSKLESAV